MICIWKASGHSIQYSFKNFCSSYLALRLTAHRAPRISYISLRSNILNYFRDTVRSKSAIIVGATHILGCTLGRSSRRSLVDRILYLPLVHQTRIIAPICDESVEVTRFVPSKRGPGLPLVVDPRSGQTRHWKLRPGKARRVHPDIDQI